jgi:CheY-like chemotaxis protein
MILSRHALPAEDNSSQPTVLVVEDEILIRAAVAEYLRKLGFTVIEAADAAEAMAVFVSGEPIDVVLSDIHLPGSMDGRDLARWINRRRSAPPVLLSSGRSGARRVDEGFIAKPYRLAALAEHLKSMLASRGSATGGGPDPR